VDEAGQLSRAEYYQFIKQQIDHQDNLVNQRVIWQIIAQAFFFSAYTSLMNAPKESKGPLFDAEQRLLLWLLPLAGSWLGS
jgi:Trk-type K+ transport system membrane component